MSRQIDRGVIAGLVLGLGFTFAVVFLFERGIPQRLLRESASAAASTADLSALPADAASQPGSQLADAGQLANAALAATHVGLASAASPSADAGPGPATNTAEIATSINDAPTQPDKEALPEAQNSWPLWALRTPRSGVEVQLPPGSRVVSLDLDPRGEQVALVLVLASGERSLHLWRFDNDLPAVLRRDGHSAAPKAGSPASEQVVEAAWSRFGAGLFVLLHSSDESRIELLSPAQGSGGTAALSQRRVIYRSKNRLANLTTASVLYEQQERIFFARQYSKEQWQILSALRDGKRVYEVTSPSGALGALTDAAVSKGQGESQNQPPHVLRLRSARPVSIHPFSGRLLFVDASGSLHSRKYTGSNWAEKSEKLNVPVGTQLRDTPNGAFLLRLRKDGLGAELIESPTQTQPTETLAKERRFLLPPLSAPTGRSVVGVVEHGDRQALLVSPVQERFAFVRYLDHIGSGLNDPLHPIPSEVIRKRLRDHGLFVTPTPVQQLYQVYEGLEYTECHEEPNVPIFASIDGFLEVMAAGFQATFMATEQLVSLPRLRRFLRELERVARGQNGLLRIGKIVAVSQLMLKGDYQHPEGKLVLSEASAESSLHTAPQQGPIDFAAFHPRGPYTATPALKNYFRAFKYLSELRVTPEEQRLLDGDAGLRQSWRAWVETQSALLFDTRLPLLFDPERALPSYVRAECVPSNLRRYPRVFPLAFGTDSEIWHGVVAHEGLPAECQVPGRLIPSGLDLLTALGSDEARAIQSSEYAQNPALRDAHDRLQRRFARPLAAGRVADSWLRLVQLLSTDRTVPEGIEPALWRRRLLQTALASWTNYRHTTVLLSENISAECGGGDPEFERLASEPLRGAVDPLPEGWEQLSRTLGMLASHSRKLLPDQPELGKLLDESAQKAHAFSGMAARQLRGVPLSQAEYAAIQSFSGAIEHPYVKFKTLLTQTQEAGLVQPEPTAKIVDISTAGRQVFHIAVGRPLQLVGLFGDRGLLVPASGAVYSFHELVADKYLDDEAWRKRSDPPLPWTPQAQLSREGDASDKAKAAVARPAPP